MGTTRRVKDIVNSNFSSLLDRAEDPEKMINMMIHEMNDSLRQLKASCSDRVAQKVQLQREIDTLTTKVEQWGGRAKLAIEKDKEDLAREAVLAKQKYEEEKTYRVRDLENLSSILEETKTQVTLVEEKLQEVQQKHRILIQRGLHAVEKRQVGSLMREVSGASVLTRFDQLENRIEQMEAEAELTGPVGVGSFDNHFTQLERDARVEEELKKLKGQPKKTPPQGEEKAS